MRTVALHFDFISPYVWLALEAAPQFAREHEVRFELRPIVYGAVLKATGLVGPVETRSKRRYTFGDIVRCAQLRGLRVVGPPAHPFRSLEALRVQELYREHPEALELARSLSAACWSEGRDLGQMGVLCDVVQRVTGEALDAATLEERIGADAVKGALRANTEAALERGVFGIPTFELDGELFWGQDRMDHLAARLRGELSSVQDASAELLARPAAVERQR